MSARTTVLAAYQIGGLLTLQKEELPHGHTGARCTSPACVGSQTTWPGFFFLREVQC
jgi:hypothetical protein